MPGLYQGAGAGERIKKCHGQCHRARLLRYRHARRAGAGHLQAIVAAIPVGRIGVPPDIGRMAAFPASDDAGFIAGATFDVNGGQFMG
nr:SDR family oxidoreductase [Massilia antarctica]